MTETKINAAFLDEGLTEAGLANDVIAEVLTNQGIDTDEAAVEAWRQGRANPPFEGG